ncbi:hypothetical protein NDU88_003544 [Pleurodeles waltl]|uniref:Uncharacterized protein n=1 Tax=Pleurodeles waltl TaxID=8319 RepID=A0AAV7TNZ8_PLEWA|nr:hypothetical protein NDU88_003544 [Pleurodeles waltl]
MHPAGLRQARWPRRRRVLRAERQREARRDVGSAPEVDPCRRGADGSPLSRRKTPGERRRADVRRRGPEDWETPSPARAACGTAQGPRRGPFPLRSP